jgi:predicted AlkP superfamily phosphohydrolase/phosphomutase
VFVETNSGITDGYPAGELMATFCRPHGYQAELVPTTRRGRSLALCRRAVPRSWRFLLSQALPVGWRGRLEARRFSAGVDWRRTTAFAIPALYAGYLRVNLKGREPLGVVEPGSQYQDLLDLVEADLRQLVDRADGRPAVEGITRTARLCGGGAPRVLPDLVVDWRPSRHPVQQVVHPRAVLQRESQGDPRGNYHSAAGLVLAAGPSIARRGAAGDLSPLELAPLFLALLGETAGASTVNRAMSTFLAAPPQSLLGGT